MRESERVKIAIGPHHATKPRDLGNQHSFKMAPNPLAVWLEEVLQVDIVPHGVGTHHEESANVQVVQAKLNIGARRVVNMTLKIGSTILV